MQASFSETCEHVLKGIPSAILWPLLKQVVKYYVWFLLKVETFQFLSFQKLLSGVDFHPMSRNKEKKKLGKNMNVAFWKIFIIHLNAYTTCFSFFGLFFFFFFWCVIYNSKRYTYGANVRLITGYLLEHGINNWTKLIETPKILLFRELLCSDNLLAKNC